MTAFHLPGLAGALVLPAALAAAAAFPASASGTAPAAPVVLTVYSDYV